MAARNWVSIVAEELIEIKVNIAGAVPEAIELLSLDEGKAREIYFVEDLTPGLSSPFPLFAAGVVLRLRREADGTGDSTVKLRPCRRSQLASAWSETAAADDDWEYRIEGDWAGSRHVLAASFVKELAADDLEAGLKDPVSAFAAQQLAFIEANAVIRINLAALTVLGTIAATRWTKIEVGSVNDVNAERWQVAHSISLSSRCGSTQTRRHRLKPNSFPTRSRLASRSTTASLPRPNRCSGCLSPGISSCRRFPTLRGDLVTDGMSEPAVDGCIPAARQAGINS